MMVRREIQRKLEQERYSIFSGGRGVPDPFIGDLCKILKSVFLQQMDG